MIWEGPLSSHENAHDIFYTGFEGVKSVETEMCKCHDL